MVATGVDLGQQAERGFAGLPAALLDKLRPYLGLKKQEAKTALTNCPLELSAAEVGRIDGLICKRYTDETAAMFGFAFEGAPKQAQAVAASLHYQFGYPGRKDSPALAQAWEAMRRGAYREAAAALRAAELWSAAHRAYMPRRDAEAALLDEAG
jgi:hypothetical protein